MLQDGLIYQESRMASVDEFISDLAPLDMNDESAVGKGGPVLFHQDGILFTDPGEGHSMIVGGTGSGKTQLGVLPIIYSCAHAGESMLIIDPKGELKRRTGLYLKRLEYDVHTLDFRKPELSEDKWNPFSRVEAFYREGKEAKAQHLQNDLMQRLFNSRSSADKDAYWNESAGMFGEGSVELSHMMGEEISIENILKWRYERLPDGTMEACFRKLPKESLAYRKLAGYFSLTAVNTKTCILSTYDQLLRLFNSADGLSKMLSESTFETASAGTRKTAIFLVVPDEKTTYHFLATVFVSQAYEGLLDLAESFCGRLPVRMNFILEEFCNMPKLPDIGPMLTAARSRNIRFHIVCQSYSQLLERYGEHMGNTLLDNCSNLIYLHSREWQFLDYLSRLAGKNEFDRPLLSTSRLQRLQKNEMLVFHERCYPFIVRDLPNMYQYAVYKKYMSDEAIERSIVPKKTSSGSRSRSGARGKV